MVNVRVFAGHAGGETFKHDVLKRLGRSKTDLSTEAGRDFVEEISAILTIRGATLYLKDFPASPSRGTATDPEIREDEGDNLDRAT